MMKIDYELAKKVKAIYHNASRGEFEPVRIICGQVERYDTKDGDWKKTAWTNPVAIEKIPPKPPVRVEYEKVEYNHIWEVMKMQSEGVDLYVKTDATKSGYGLIQNNPTSLLVASTSNLYRRIEKPVDWRELTIEFADKCGFHGIGAITLHHSDRFLEMCRVALRANGEL